MPDRDRGHQSVLKACLKTTFILSAFGPPLDIVHLHFQHAGTSHPAMTAAEGAAKVIAGKNQAQEPTGSPAETTRKTLKTNIRSDPSKSWAEINKN
jgi:hypothetical protein